MINILTLSEDGTRLAQIMRLISECGNYRTTRASEIRHCSSNEETVLMRSTS